jgi:hypothetical protein
MSSKILDNIIIAPLTVLAKPKKNIIRKAKPITNVDVEDPDLNKDPIIKNAKSAKSLKPCAKEISFHNYKILEDTKEKENAKEKVDYKAAELKEMCIIIQREYDYKKIKITGTKQEMKQSVYNFYNDTIHCIKIQLKFKSYLRRKLKKLRGPALRNRDVCINETDFYTLDPIRDIPNNQFFSYEEQCYGNNNNNNDDIKKTKMSCFGFDIASIFNLILSDNGVENEYGLSRRLIWNESNNPYNRNKIPHNVIRDILKIIKLDRILNSKRTNNNNNNKNKKVNRKGNNNNINNNYEYDNNHYFEEDEFNNNNNNANNGSIVISLPQDVLTPQQLFRQHVLRLFQTINALGHYSDPEWFIALTYEQHITFLRELIDIWNYRAELSPQARRTIYPPYGDPFPHYVMGWITHQFYIYLSPENIINLNLTVIERFITSAVAEADRCLGSNFILCALTLVSVPAREALPWLYQSVMHA